MSDWLASLRSMWSGNGSNGGTSGVPLGATWTPSFEGLTDYGASMGTGISGLSGPSMGSNQAFSLSGPQANYAVPQSTVTQLQGGDFSNMPQMQQSAGGLKGWLSNGQNLGVAIQGLGTLANAYLGFQQMKAAKEGLKFQKEAFNANLGNSIKTYNTSLEDRINGRTSAYAGKDQDVAAYLAKHSLKR